MATNTVSAEQRSKNLFDFFGWQGGTIHQIAQETGINVDTLLYAEPSSAPDSKYSHGRMAASCLSTPARIYVGLEAKGNKDFWIGVALEGVRS